MIVNRREIARRIANRKGYRVGDIDEILLDYEEIVVEAIQNGEEVKHGKLYKLGLQKLPEKKAYDGLNKRYFIRPAKLVPKFKPLAKLDFDIPIDEEGD